MRGIQTTAALLLVVSVPLVIGAGDQSNRRTTNQEQAVHQTPPVPEVLDTDLAGMPGQQISSAVQASSARQPLYHMNRFSVHTGGDADATSTNLRAGVFVGESVVGQATSTSFRANVGFWFGQAGATVCPIALTGDVNLTGGINLTDVIVLVNYVLKAGPDPEPCPAGGDVNCTGEVNSTDIIYLVNYVLRAGPAPCDACALIPGTWGCP